MATATTAGTTPAAGGRSTAARAHVQGFGTFLSGMIMPNIGAFIAWGLITAFFIEAGFTPFGPLGGFGENAEGEPHTGLVGPMITYLLPLLIAYTGGWKVHDVRGGVVGAMATMGVIVGTGILAAVMAICGLFPVGPAVLAFSNAAAAVVDFLATRGCAVLPPRGRSSPSSPRPPPTATWASPSP